MAPLDDQSVDDDEKKTGAALGAKRRFDEFECPACSANNPWGDGFGNNDEVLCNWCGMQYLALVDEEGTLRLKEA